MSLPILEQITANVVTTLQGITVANGYTYNLTIEREKRRGNAPADKKVVVYQTDPTEIQNPETLRKEWLQPYHLDVFIQIADDEIDTVYPSTVINSIVADIHKALMVDRYRGSLAMDTVIKAHAEFQLLDGSFDGVAFNFEVHYRTLEVNPYVEG